MTKFTGQCLCGTVSFKADGDVQAQGNCHCTDCQKSSGTAFTSIIFMSAADVVITGELSRFDHTVDSGNVLTKSFCSKCGSQMFGYSSGRPGVVILKAGTLNEEDVFSPQFNVFKKSKMACTVLDETIPAYEALPPK